MAAQDDSDEQKEQHMIGENQYTEAAMTAREMPRYKCHKEVWALKIKEITDPTIPGNESDGSRLIHPEEAGYGPFVVDHEYTRKHNPQVGGYYVVYKDGYKSFSPAEAFEDGYTLIR